MASTSSSTMMLPISLQLSPGSNTATSTTATATQQQQHHCSLKRALIPLICVLILFLINTNVRGLYLEYSARSIGIGNGGLAKESLAINPIPTGASSSFSSDATNHKKLIQEETNSNGKARGSHLNDDISWEVEKLIMEQELAFAADDDGVDLMTYQEYIDREQEEYGNCFKNTTNFYRPPNITNTNNTTTTQHPQRLSKKKKKKNKRKTQHIQPIPRRLIFTYKTNLFDCNFPQHLYDNVQNTIQLYGEFWGIPNKTDVDVLFFDDKECAQAIEAAEPRLLPVFLAEENGSYRGDICRIAALYLYGGYYLDVDIQPIKALDPPDKVDFITSQAGNNLFFQAILATKPGHPLIKHTLETMLDDWYMIPKIMKEFNMSRYKPGWFRGQAYADMRMEHVTQFGFDPKHAIGVLMGPATLRIAFDRRRDVTTPWLLDEIENRQLNMYPKLVRETNHWGCNFLVHDAIRQAPYFYSRCVGTPMCPNLDSDINKFYPEDDGYVDESLDEEDEQDVEKSSGVAYE